MEAEAASENRDAVSAMTLLPAVTLGLPEHLQNKPWAILCPVSVSRSM
jgi:hypothetical protein